MTAVAQTGAKRRLRIAVLNRVFSPTGGGAERYSIALVEQLAQRHDIHVFAQQIDHHWPGVTYHRVSAPLVRPRWINQLWYASATWWATRRGFDVVHSHENTWHGQVQTVHVLPIKYNLFLGRAGWRLGVRWLKVLTSPRLLVYLWLEQLRYGIRNRRSIVLTSHSLQSVMAQTYPAALPAMKVLTPGVTSVAGVTSLADRRAARLQLGLPEAGPCILFIGNDYRKKGLVTLIQALQHLPHDSFLVVVGNAAQIPGFRASVQASGLGQRIFFLGALRNVTQAYLSADCLAHPTLEDTFGMVVLEAMAHGLPVVVSSARYCGISGLLTHEVNSLILEDPLDSIALAQALRRLLAEPALRHGLGEAAVVFAKRYQWADIASQQEVIYFSVLDAPD